MKEDVLEQIGNDWLLQTPGVFVKTNLKYRPPENHPTFKFVHSSDGIHSDIDVLSINTSSLDTVTVLNCKAWMDGLDFQVFHDHLSDPVLMRKSLGGKEYWKHFRELVDPKWHLGFVDRIKLENPGVVKIRYIVLCTIAKNKGSVTEWTTNPIIQKNFKLSGLELVSIEAKDLADLVSELDTKPKDYAENSEFTRMLQLLRTANLM